MTRKDIDRLKEPMKIGLIDVDGHSGFPNLTGTMGELQAAVPFLFLGRVR